MGNGRWSSNAWDNYASANVSGKSAGQVFTSRNMKSAYNPREILVRESRDSADNPNSTPIILAADVTASMGMISHNLMQTGLNTLAKEIYDRKPVSDPHIMVMAIGDAKTDSAPAQATQFEADISLADQVRELWIESGGGGNGGESYSLAHYFAAAKTVSDSWEKRRKKGYLFTIGDEPIHDGLTAAEVEKVFGISPQGNMSAQDCVDMAMKTYEVFHIVLKNEGDARYNLPTVLDRWQKIIGQRVILLDDYTKLAEVVVSTIQVIEGANKATVANSWSGSTAMTVANAIENLPSNIKQGGVVRLAS
jgi:hypothetical protein